MELITHVDKMSLICGKSVTTQNLGTFELLLWEETSVVALLTGVVS